MEESSKFYSELLKLNTPSEKYSIKEEEDEFEKYISNDDLGAKRESRIKKELRNSILTQVTNEIKDMYEP